MDYNGMQVKYQNPQNSLHLKIHLNKKKNGKREKRQENEMP